MRVAKFSISTLFSLLTLFISVSSPSFFEANNTRIGELLYSGWNHLLNIGSQDSLEDSLSRVFDQESADDALYGDESWQLETKKDEASEPERVEQVRKRNFYRVSNKVFSRVDLPELYRPPKSKPGAFCQPLLGCLDEVASLPSILSWGNVSASFIVYSSSKPKATKLTFEPLVHYQLDDTDVSDDELKELNFSLPQTVRSRAASLTFRRDQLERRPLRVSAKSWQSASKVKRKLELPFDLAAFEGSEFDPSLNTRIIIGGYFAKEEEKWINEVVRNWLNLEPCNVIKVSWADSNRGLYHAASFNSRIVARQLTQFIYYLDQLFGVDLNRFHLVGHSLGAHIAGQVGTDNEGRVARITGLDPAGPIFSELDSSLRLDPSDAKFVDIIHTNGGQITRGALGLFRPSGHVDYYPNGGSSQPGCDSTAALVDPVERIACNHRRSYRYFIEILKLAVNERNCAANKSDNCDLRDLSRPQAFLFEAKQEELENLVHPDLSCLSDGEILHDRGSETIPLSRQVEFHRFEPLDFPTGRRGLYFFRTRHESPYFGEYPRISTRQSRVSAIWRLASSSQSNRILASPACKMMGLTIRSQMPTKRRMTLSLRLGDQISSDIELDSLEAATTLTFVQPTSSAVRGLPRLALMWRYRAFYLLAANQPNDLQLSSLTLIDLESVGSGSNLVIKYFAPHSNSTRQVGSGTELTLVRNRWYKFEGRAVILKQI